MKIEFDLPEFDKEIKVEIIIRKDGEVVYSATSSPANNVLPKEEETQKPKKPTKTAGDSKFSGNLMGMDF